MSDALCKRVLGKVRRLGECWIWCGHTTKGIPRMVISTDEDRELTGVRSRTESRDPQVAYVRRVSWALHTGEPPPKEGFLSAVCHNALCISPFHIVHVDNPQTLNVTIFDSFWDHVDVRGPDDCWEWQRSRSDDGYGYVSISKTDAATMGIRPGTAAAHRVSWSLAHGRRSPGKKCVLHSCDNPPCVNPKHLRLGTHVMNAHDFAERGNPGQRKLSDEDIVEVRTLRCEGAKIAHLSKRFSVSCSTIRWHTRKA